MWLGIKIEAKNTYVKRKKFFFLFFYFLVISRWEESERILDPKFHSRRLCVASLASSPLFSHFDSTPFFYLFYFHSFIVFSFEIAEKTLIGKGYVGLSARTLDASSSSRLHSKGRRICQLHCRRSFSLVFESQLTTAVSRLFGPIKFLLFTTRSI